MDLSQHVCPLLMEQEAMRDRLRDELRRAQDELAHLKSTRERDYAYFKEVYAERDGLKANRENCVVCECNIRGVASALETVEAERNILKTDLFAAKRTSNYWKSEHLAANAVIDHLKAELALARAEAIRQTGYREMRDAYAAENATLREQATRLEAELEVERLDSNGLGARCDELEDKCNELEREYKAARAKAERNSELAWRSQPGGTSMEETI